MSRVILSSDWSCSRSDWSLDSWESRSMYSSWSAQMLGLTSDSSILYSGSSDSSLDSPLAASKKDEKPKFF